MTFTIKATFTAAGVSPASALEKLQRAIEESESARNSTLTLDIVDKIEPKKKG